ncbi:MAG: sulfatase-like hydrolase/transferase [Oscillospiraceae bacterium]|nr:sulfatase-like hydrolase/transferase [Oscillospiraceae bacterium]
MSSAVKKTESFLGKAAIPVFFVLLVLSDLAFRFFYRTADSLPIVYPRALLFTLCWSLLLCGAVYCLPSRGRRAAMVIIMLFCCFAYIVHGVMYNLFGTFFSFADIAYAGDGAKFFSAAYLKVRKGMLLTCALTLIITVSCAASLPSRKWKARQLVIGLIMIAAAISGIYINHRDLMPNETDEAIAWDSAMKTSDAFCYRELKDVNRCMSLCGSYQYLYHSLAVTYGFDGSADPDKLKSELDEYYSSPERSEHPVNEMSGVFEDKNLIFIMLESVDTWMLTEEYMPNLYSLQQKSMNFVNYYSPQFITAGTFNTEFIANTGLIPPQTNISPDAYTNNAFPYSLAQLFRNEGYSARSFHSADPVIYNRGEIHLNLGFESYSYWLNMGMDNYMLDSQLTRGFSRMTEGDSFFSFIITFSGHGPYTDEMSDISAPHMDRASELTADKFPDASEKNRSEYTHAVAHAMETDDFIGDLVQKLEYSGLSENTVLVLFTDHYSKYMTDHEFTQTVKGISTSTLMSICPFMIYSEDMPPAEITKLCSSVDILPTVANLFGLDAPYRYYAGHDIFGSGEGYAVLPNGCWLSEDMFYNPANTELKDKDSVDLNIEIRSTVEMSQNAVRCDYFGIK